jgi:hypothetical protein
MADNIHQWLHYVAFTVIIEEIQLYVESQRSSEPGLKNTELHVGASEAELPCRVYVCNFYIAMNFWIAYLGLVNQCKYPQITLSVMIIDENDCVNSKF